MRNPAAISFLSRAICLLAFSTISGIVAAQVAQPWPEDPAEAAKRPQISGPNDRPAMTPNVTVIHKSTVPMTCPEYAALKGAEQASTTPIFAPPEITFVPWSNDPLVYQEYHCPCNHIDYKDMGVCQASCRTSLACFVGICDPVKRERPQICVKATASVQFSLGSLTTTIFDWNSFNSDQAAPACQAAWNNYENFLIDHEMHHATDIIADLGQWNTAHAKATLGPVEVCADSLEAAEKGARGEIYDLRTPYQEELLQTIYNTSHVYHYYGDAIGFTPGLACSACPSTSQ